MVIAFLSIILLYVVTVTVAIVNVETISSRMEAIYADQFANVQSWFYGACTRGDASQPACCGEKYRYFGGHGRTGGRGCVPAEYQRADPG